ADEGVHRPRRLHRQGLLRDRALLPDRPGGTGLRAGRLAAPLRALVAGADRDGRARAGGRAGLGGAARAAAKLIDAQLPPTRPLLPTERGPFPGPAGRRRRRGGGRSRTTSRRPRALPSRRRATPGGPWGARRLVASAGYAERKRPPRPAR